ncbi:MAG: hypothetical protein LLG03_14080 [Planctomycetaceae bacterium]|nr:hypothetical protein [Planctomycetaceae bacterium]
MNYRSLALTAILILLAAAPAWAGVNFAGVFGDNMVLQCDMPVAVWGGGAAAGEKVTVTFADQSKTATADAGGNWKVTLDKLAASDKGAELKAAAGADAATVKDVLVGEVWVGSGQSNMFLEMKSIWSKDRWTKFIGETNFPNIRLSKGNGWQPCSRGSVSTFSGCGFYFARNLHQELKVPVGIVVASSGGSFIEQWMPESGDLFARQVRPMLGMTIRGVIWYQGEANAIKGDGMGYLAKHEKLIAGWRKAWGQDNLPFHFVQIVPCSMKMYKPTELAKLWQAQRATLTKVPNTGMAICTDLCSDGMANIHPRNKWDVGRRLALSALHQAYGKKDLVYSGPLYKSVEIKGSEAAVSFDLCNSTGLSIRGKEGDELSWFEIAGADGKFVKAAAKIGPDGKSVIVSAAEVKEPANVRFGWDNAAVPNLINKEGLPASPFSTEKQYNP